MDEKQPDIPDLTEGQTAPFSAVGELMRRMDELDGGSARLMSLRDHVATAALAGLLTNPSMISPGQLKASRHHDQLCGLSWDIADTMIEARKTRSK